VTGAALAVAALAVAALAAVALMGVALMGVALAGVALAGVALAGVALAGAAKRVRAIVGGVARCYGRLGVVVSNAGIGRSATMPDGSPLHRDRSRVALDRVCQFGAVPQAV
jgi:NAD(P)-dependent dehydrogenase (short-subunit alcohol dehydrogenase family)